MGGRVSERTIRRLLNEFHGASDYYRLIARKNGIRDHFADEVVEAYWLGNRLLEKVGADDLKKMILSDFVKPDFLSAAKAKKIIEKIPSGVAPHHSFHVFFVGSVTGRLKFNPKLREVCKTCWGEVKRLEPLKGTITVKTKILAPRPHDKIMPIGWDRELAPSLKPGDAVSFHWGRVSQKISSQQLKNLIKYTLRNFSAYQRTYGKRN